MFINTRYRIPSYTRNLVPTDLGLGCGVEMDKLTLCGQASIDVNRKITTGKYLQTRI